MEEFLDALDDAVIDFRWTGFMRNIAVSAATVSAWAWMLWWFYYNNPKL